MSFGSHQAMTYTTTCNQLLAQVQPERDVRAANRCMGLGEALWYSSGVSNTCGIGVTEAALVCIGLQQSRLAPPQYAAALVVLFLCGVVVGILLVPVSGSIRGIRAAQASSPSLWLKAQRLAQCTARVATPPQAKDHQQGFLCPDNFGKLFAVGCLPLFCFTSLTRSFACAAGALQDTRIGGATPQGEANLATGQTWTRQLCRYSGGKDDNIADGRPLLLSLLCIALLGADRRSLWPASLSSRTAFINELCTMRTAAELVMPGMNAALRAALRPLAPSAPRQRLGPQPLRKLALLRWRWR